MTRKNPRKSNAKPVGLPETKTPRTEKKKDVALQVAADVPPPAESPKKLTTPEPMDASAPPARSLLSRGPQCYKCQRWGHVSYVCNHDTRCVKCALGHKAADCPKKAEDPCCCANCGGSHLSSYRGCAAAPKTRRRRTKPKPKQQDQGKEKGVISKLANLLCKLMLTKDFFSEAQLEFISQEMDGKPKPQTSHASSQATPPQEIEEKPETREVTTQTEDLKQAQAAAGTQIEIQEDGEPPKGKYPADREVSYLRKNHPALADFNDVEIWTYAKIDSLKTYQL